MNRAMSTRSVRRPAPRLPCLFVSLRTSAAVRAPVDRPALARASSDDQGPEGYWATAVKRAAAAAAAMEKGSAAQPSAAPIAGLLKCEPINRLLARFDAAQREGDGVVASPRWACERGWPTAR